MIEYKKYIEHMIKRSVEELERYEKIPATCDESKANKEWSLKTLKYFTELKDSQINDEELTEYKRGP